MFPFVRSSLTNSKLSPEEAILAFLGLEAPLQHIVQSTFLNKNRIIIANMYSRYLGFPGGAVVKNPPASAGNVGLTPEPGRSPEEGNGNPFQYSFLGTHGQRSLVRYSRVATKSRTQLSMQAQQTPPVHLSLKRFI